MGNVIRAYDRIVEQLSRQQQELEETLRLRAKSNYRVGFGNPLPLQIGHSSDTLSESKTTAIEPITLQLALDSTWTVQLALDSTWTDELHQSASQVSLEFVCNNLLCHHHLSRLLQNSAWVMSTLKFLGNTSLLDKSFWEKNTIQGILPLFESILGDTQHPEFQIQAAQTLGRLVSHKLNWENIFGRKGVLHQLVNLMSQVQNAEVQCSGALFFIACSHSHNDSDTIRKLVLFPPLLPVLVEALRNDRNALLQTQVGLTLQNFACAADSPTRRRIVDSPLLLETLVASLAKYQDPSLQWDAAWAVANLATRNAGEGMREQMANFPMLLKNLESCLDQDEDPNLQVQAARALINLACPSNDTLKLSQILAVSLERKQDPILQQGAAAGLGDLARYDDANRDRILSIPGLLGNLVKSLDDDLNSRLQIDAVRALLNLASTSDTRIKVRIVRFPPMLGSLVDSLRKFQNPCLQYRAAWAIANLAAEGADQPIRDQIANFPGLLDNLEISLDQDDNPNLRLRAARALISLRWTKDTSKLLRILAVSLEGKEDPLLQEAAAIGLAHLPHEDETIEEQILSFPGLLQNLEQALDDDVNCGLRVRAARVLIRFAKTKDIAKLLQIIAVSLEGKQDPPVRGEAAGLVEDLARGKDDAVKDQILNYPELLENLVKSLVDDVNCGVQTEAARALINLASTTNTSIKVRTLISPLVLESVVASLGKCHNPDLQSYAAWIIANLAIAREDQEVTRKKIADFPGLLYNLEASLDQDDNPNLRVRAVRALINLAWTKDTPKLLRTLAMSLERKQDPSLQESAAGALSDLALGDDMVKEQIVSFPGMLENFVQALDDDLNCGIQTQVVRPIVNLACALDTSVKARILSFPSLSGSLVAALRKVQNPTLQSYAAWAIANLAGAGNEKEQIANCPGLLDNLETSLDQDDNPTLRVRAARALVNLAWAKDSPKLLRILAVTLEGEQDPDLRQAAAACLDDLARVDDPNRDRIVTFPGLVENLIKSLGDDVNRGLQTGAANALLSLTTTEVLAMKIRMLSFPLLLESLVASFRKDQNPGLELWAMMAVANFAGEGADQAIREKIANFPRVLDHFENSLEREDPQIRAVSAVGLVNLERTEDTPRLLAILAVSLEGKEDNVLQSAAAEGLANLERKDDDVTKDQILSFPGLVGNLVKLLDDDVKGDLQEKGARCLLNLASSRDTSMKVKVLRSPELLKGLVGSLRKCKNLGLQWRAAGAIGNLAGEGSDDVTREEIGQFPGLLENLESCLDQDDNPNLRVRAARALLNLAWTKDTPKLLRILAGPLEGTRDPSLQEAAAIGPAEAKISSLQLRN